ncbi:hypothetical protein MSAN_01203100 [Mycena sanguinolenta]|uniref:Uncharacterized protein n=1 Tax=Mycena sanguinolenta TaxID=230812 RepID=A0A8H6YFA1_9AGAR|nr:hypothetical protein MSAN_01203100 [Mycena sanguinolenta]
MVRSAVGLRRFALPWSDLTAVALECLKARECLDVLIDAPLLTKCSFEETSGPVPPVLWVITHTSLREFSISGSSILRSLTLPHLRTLTLGAEATTDEVSLIERSAHSLREFTIPRCYTWDYEISIDWFWIATELRTGRLRDIPPP